jgi:phosphoenolpyruvate carboxykinase (GTP)
MLPFCGYNMGDYFAHWLKVGGSADASKLPRIYFVNWFRKDADGKYVWPGFGENSRVLKWISDRLGGTADAVDTPIGRVPSRESIDVAGLGLSDDQLDLLLTVDVEAWREEAALVHPHYERFGKHTPKELWDQLAALEQRLQ